MQVKRERERGGVGEERYIRRQILDELKKLIFFFNSYNFYGFVSAGLLLTEDQNHYHLGS